MFDSDEVSVLLGGPGGSFGEPTDFAVGDGPGSLAIGDFNADADPDLAVANLGRSGASASNTVSVLLGGPGGGFGAPTDFAVGERPISVAVADFNADADPDLAVADHYDPSVRVGAVSVLLGGPGGSFGARTDYSAGLGPLSVAVGDLNADADPDLAVANYDNYTVSVWLGGPGGGFRARTDFSAGNYPSSVAIGDFNADADPDLAVATALPSVSVLTQVPPECTITGTPGPDELIGTGDDDVLCGLEGADTIRGRGGGDVLRGRTGRDVLIGGPGADELIGGGARDKATYAHRVAPLELSIGDGANDGAAGEHDQISDDVEIVRAGVGNDVLTGDDGANWLLGGDGQDTLTGGLGDDQLVGKRGNDTLDARDGPAFTDTLLCGAGTDTALADPADQVGPDCEG
jgi:Ca2+-binding RTX toxin-like protein